MCDIDIQRAQSAFYKYTEGFPVSEERIDHKIQHSTRVAGRSLEVSTALNLSRADISLAAVIGLIHDLGRFEQHMRFGTYVDRKSEDHATSGVKLLFGEGLIREFVLTDKYDIIIKSAVAYHNAYELPCGLEGKELLHCKIIRDADKLDNLYTMQFQSFTSLFGKENISDEPLTRSVMRDFLAFKPIRHIDTITNMDTWIKYIAFHFGLYFNESLKIACSGAFGESMLKRVEDHNDIGKIRAALNAYLYYN